MNNRRKLLIALGAGGGALALPIASLAQQQAKIWRVGVLVQERRPASLESHRFGAFPLGMRNLGYVEGENLVIEWRFADGVPERLPGLAAELVQIKVDVILAATTPPTAAAQKATTTIPIVMASVGDPVGSGFVKSLAHPGGNITGVSNLSAELGGKHMEFLHALLPKLSRVAALTNPANSTGAKILVSIEAAARRNGVTVLTTEARNPQEIESAFLVMIREKVGALIVVSDALFAQQNRQIAELAAKHRLPSIDGLREFAEVGGLMSYGTNRADHYTRAATYVDKIFKGAKPADLPVEQATRFEFIVNGKTAKLLGLSIPNELLLQADKLIE
jgi:putative tryptophan/tyrosine transport system substrate-binding protein